jgi:radical SAM protein with 4Fe4S-binding SPASM domain
MLTSSIGNLGSETLFDVFREGRQNDYWRLTKDKLARCGQCEYRGLCSDCALFEIRGDSDPNLFNIVCSYEPYTGSWAQQERFEGKENLHVP